MADFNCPNCGDAITQIIHTAKMAVCTSCDTSLLLESDHVKSAGTAGVMRDAPSLFELGQTYEYVGQTYTIHGHARFDYGRGWWDEFWAVAPLGDHIWISLDEGDLLVQVPVMVNEIPKTKTVPKLGEAVLSGSSTYTVREHSKATCIALRGQFEEPLKVGQSYTYVNCIGDAGEILSGEFSTGTPDWYQGSWIDPYDLDIPL